MLVKRNIYFFAKVGALDKLPYGGGEVGNRRTMQMLREIGYEVVLIDRYYNYDRKNLLTYMKIIAGDIVSVMRFCLIIGFGTRKDTVVHISGFTGQYMPLEFLSIVLAKLFGYKVTYEIRGGGIIGFYNNGGLFYKYLFTTAVKLADTVFSQGFENKTLIGNVCNTKFFYYPNCVAHEFIPKRCPIKSETCINLLYIGRVSPVKNVNVVVSCLYELLNMGFNARLDVIGDSEDCPGYMEILKQYVLDNNIDEKCIFHGKLSKEKMKPFLSDATFFLFPTQEKREGQSNSLTETMGFGIIPIASSQGYNRAIIGQDELIEDNLSPLAYANRVASIWLSGQVWSLSTSMYDRVLQNFTYTKIKESVTDEYSRIFSTF